MKLVVEPELAQVFDYIDWVADNSTQMDPLIP